MSTTPSTADQSGSSTVGGYYDRWTDLFVRGFGPILQAGILTTGDPPKEDPEQSVIALAEKAGIRDGDHILDAGCGVAGPAIVIASHFPHASVDGVTVSREQVVLARERIVQRELQERVRVHQADYQNLPFADGMFDQVIYFESTGYASDVDRMCTEAFRVLKPGGRLYVKDVFCRSGPITATEAADMSAFDRLWGCVRSKTLDELVEASTHAGLEIEGHGELADVGTARLLGSMFQLNVADGLRTSELGSEFHLAGLSPPILFGELRASKPSSKP